MAGKSPRSRAYENSVFWDSFLFLCSKSSVYSQTSLWEDYHAKKSTEQKKVALHFREVREDNLKN